jgi:signal transduction histidine kinase
MKPGGSKTGASVNRSSSDAPAESSLNQIDKLQQENRELVRISRYRSLFLARLAHELRTPLTSILGFSEILLNQEKLTDAQNNFCERIQSSARQLQNSLNQLSDLARLESGQTHLSCEEFSLADIMRESLSAVARGAQKKRAILRSDVDDNLPLLMSDRGRLRQVIYNGLAYAIARSPEQATVEVSAKVNDEGAEIIIVDSGDHIANPGEIGMLDADNDKAGSGELGLAIARQNIQLLGGAISAANRDVGLELRIKLPRNAPR